MKKTFICFILLCASIALSAQDRPFNFGLHGTPNFSWIKPDVDGAVYKSNGSTVHMGYGAEFNYFFIDNIGIGTGVDVTYTGGKLQYATKYPSSTDSIGILDRRYRLQYLQVPVVLIGTTGNMLGKFSIYAKFGIGTSFKLRARANDEFTPSYNTSTTIVRENINITKEVAFVRESMIIGIGGTYKAAKLLSINACLSYNNGFTDILKSNNLATPDVKENARANYFELSFGLLF